MWEKHTVVEALLAHPQIDPTRRGADGDTVLHAAASSGTTRCTEILLLDGRVSPNEVNDKGVTPLMLGVETGNEEVISLLLKHGADPNITTPQGKVVCLLYPRSSYN